MRQSEAAGDPDLHAAELRVYADFLRIVLEILNCILTTRLAENPELVYALLHRQEVFAPFRVCIPVERGGGRGRERERERERGRAHPSWGTSFALLVPLSC